MSSVDIVRCMSTAQMVFTVDQLRCLSPFDKQRNAQLIQRFELASSSVQETGEQLSWLCRKGTSKLSETRRLPIHFIWGYEHELSVTVEGATDEALDVLQDIWTALGEIAEEEAVALDERLGAFSYQTTAVVKLPKTYRELFPGIALLAQHTREGVEGAPMGAPGVESFRAETRLSFAVGAIPVERLTFIEPLFTSKVDDRTFFTQSPLRSDRHLAMLEALCALGEGG